MSHISAYRQVPFEMRRSAVTVFQLRALATTPRRASDSALIKRDRPIPFGNQA